MSKVRFLVVDDLAAGRIAGLIRERFERPDWGQQIIDVVSIDKFSRAPEQMKVPYEVAIFDIRDEANKTASGDMAALIYATLHPEALVIVKTTHTLSAMQKEALQVQKNLRIAAGARWDDLLTEAIDEWVLKGRTTPMVRRRHQLVDASVSSEAALNLTRASRLVDESWLVARSDSTLATRLATLRIFGEQLARDVGAPLPSRDQWPYLRVQVDAAAPWVPWEYLLFRADTDLATPIAYKLGTAAPERDRDWSLRRVLFVHGTGVEWPAEYAAIEASFEWTDRVKVDERSFGTFVGDLRAEPADVVHFAMHGPTAPDAAFPQRAALINAIRRAHPRMVVLNACHGLYLLLGGAQRRYPLTVNPLNELLETGIDSIITTHLPLDDTSMPAIWSQAFYPAFAVTGDAAVSAGWARREVAERLARLCELATVVISRPGSWFTA